MKYEQIPEISAPEIEAALKRDNPEELLIAVLSAALYASDAPWASSVCERLSRHPHATVRGNAVLGFGHIARRHRTLDRTRVAPILASALRGVDAYVRGQAEAAADDVELYLGWQLERHTHAPSDLK